MASVPVWCSSGRPTLARGPRALSRDTVMPALEQACRHATDAMAPARLQGGYASVPEEFDAAQRAHALLFDSRATVPRRPCTRALPPSACPRAARRTKAAHRTIGACSRARSECSRPLRLGTCAARSRLSGDDGIVRPCRLSARMDTQRPRSWRPRLRVGAIVSLRINPSPRIRKMLPPFNRGTSTTTGGAIRVMHSAAELLP
jgi:hypothetical protein